MDTVQLADVSAGESCRLGGLKLWRERFDEERVRRYEELDFGTTLPMHWPQVQTRPVITSDASQGLVDFDDKITQRHLLDDIEKFIGLEAFGFADWVRMLVQA